jgi:hypothetical protein
MTASRYTGQVVLRRIPARVVVVEAPATSRITLEAIQQSASGTLGVRGDRLHFGWDEQGNEVVYRVVGWDTDVPSLLIERQQP